MIYGSACPNPFDNPLCLGTPPLIPWTPLLLNWKSLLCDVAPIPVHSDPWLAVHWPPLPPSLSSPFPFSLPQWFPISNTCPPTTTLRYRLHTVRYTRVQLITPHSRESIFQNFEFGGWVYSGLSPFGVKSIRGWLHSGFSPIWGWVHSDKSPVLGSVILGLVGESDLSVPGCPTIEESRALMMDVPPTPYCNTSYNFLSMLCDVVLGEQSCQSCHLWILSLPTRQKYKPDTQKQQWLHLHKTIQTPPSYETWQWDGTLLPQRETFLNAYKVLSLGLLPSKTKETTFQALFSRIWMRNQDFKSAWL